MRSTVDVARRGSDPAGDAAPEGKALVMPWKTGAAFAAKHNKKLKGAAATTAKKQAEAMIARGVPVGEAIATANKTGDRIAARRERWYG
jgi:hypothetical protein